MDSASWIFIGTIFIIIVCSALYAYGTKREIKITIKDKGTLTYGYVNEGNGQTRTDFMVYTKNNESFKNVNSLWYWKWRSTELQNKIQQGKTYTAVVYGWRIGGLNVYPNIVKIKETKHKK